MVLFFLRLIAWLVPDVPAALATKIKRKRFLAKRSLEHNREALRSVSKACGPGPHPLFPPPGLSLAFFPRPLFWPLPLVCPH